MYFLGCVILLVDLCKWKSRQRCVGNINFILSINICMNTHIMGARISYIFVFVQVYKKCD